MGYYKTIAVGDIHGDFTPLVSLIKNNKDAILLQCGDFGWWKPLRNRILDVDRICKENNVIIHWCEGNHEDHPFIKKNDMVTPNIIHQPRGSTITLPDGRVVLFIGGADSIDKKYRTAGYDWFPEDENITINDIRNLPDIDVDVIISHTAPEYFDLMLPKTGHFAGTDLSTYKDNNCILLNLVFDKYKPKEWYFGHFHKYDEGEYNNCEWVLLSDTKHGMWYRNDI